MAADNAFAATLPATALPGYDVPQKDGLAPGAQFARTTVMTKSGAPQGPRAGGGNTGQEP